MAWRSPSQQEGQGQGQYSIPILCSSSKDINEKESLGQLGSKHYCSIINNWSKTGWGPTLLQAALSVWSRIRIKGTCWMDWKKEGGVGQSPNYGESVGAVEAHLPLLRYPRDGDGDASPLSLSSDACKVLSHFMCTAKLCLLFNQTPSSPRDPTLKPSTWPPSFLATGQVRYLPPLYLYSQALLLLLTVNLCLILLLPTPPTMRALLLRTSSVPVLPSTSPGLSLGVHDCLAGSFSGDRTGLSSPRISLHFRNHSQREVSSRRIRRALSESNIIRSGSGISALNGVGSRSFPARIAEEEDDDDKGRPLVVQQPSADRVNYAVSWPEIGMPVEELGVSGGGADDEESCSFTGGGDGDRQKLAAYYEEMLKSNPGDALLLRNYGKFLHKV